MNGAHALLSPSGSDRWMTCPGSVALEAPLPDGTTEYADEGTAAHEVGKWCLQQGKDAFAWQGRRIEIVNGVYYPGTGPLPANLFGHKMPIRRMFEVTEDMATAVQKYVEIVKALARNGELLVEQKLPIGHITGEEGATGTSDAVVLAVADDELIVADLKFGRGVKVYADHNRQAMLYALGALHEYELLADWKNVRIVIIQPRLDHVDEFVCTVKELIEFVQVAAAAAWDATAMLAKRIPLKLVPSEKACQFCKAKEHACCPALDKFVSSSIGADFEVIAGAAAGGTLEQHLLETQAAIQNDGPWLSVRMKAIDLIEDWCKGVRAQTERILLDGGDVPGYKLVPGKKGNRAWTDADAAEKLLKSFRLKSDQMYDFKLISPTTAEKVLKAKPKQWKKAIDLIGQADGKPSVAEDSDKREAIKRTPVADDFAPVEEACDLA